MKIVIHILHQLLILILIVVTNMRLVNFAYYSYKQWFNFFKYAFSCLIISLLFVISLLVYSPVLATFQVMKQTNDRKKNNNKKTL